MINSPEEHTLSSFDEVRSQRFPEILDSICGSQRFSVKKSLVYFCICDKLDLVFSASSTVRSNQSSITSSYLIQDVDPSKSDGIFVVIPLPSTLRDVFQPKIRPVCQCLVLGCHQDLPHSHSSLTLLEYSSITHSRGIVYTTRSSSSLLSNKTKRSATTLWPLILFFLCGPYVTKYSGHWTRTHNTVMILSLLWIVTGKRSGR